MRKNNREKRIKSCAGGEITVKKGKKKKILLAVFLALVFLAYFFVGMAGVGVMYTERTLGYWTPDYDMVDIKPILEKETLTQEDYDILYKQTGVTKLGVDSMRAQSYFAGKMLDIQESFFRRRELVVENFAPFCYSEMMDIQSYKDYSVVADLQDGDILVSNSMRVSWWRFGHSALVVNGQSRLILEAMEPGLKSMVNYVNTFEVRPNFILLRPKIDEKIKKEVASYAFDNLRGLEYNLYPGVFSPKFEENITKTHCSHVVWYAYKKFNIDIDSNGGGIVTPEDIYNSEYMEVVQVFGLNPDTLWG